MADAHSVVATIQPAITLLGLGIGAALASRALRLNPIVGYIGLGLGLASLGTAKDFSGPLVAAMAEAGVMILLFNLGLHFSLGRIRAEAGNIFGFGALQMLVAGEAFAALLAAFGLPLAFAVIAGFGLGLSSTAVVIGLIREREQEDCPFGRAAQAILIFQDIAAIMLLVGAGTLAEGGNLLPALGVAGAKALAAFAVAVLFARFLTEPLFRLIARAGTTEVYTATALFIALAAGWATGMAGLSLTLGAFIGGMAVADSRYRILVQTEIDAFRGLFLSFFFISVGLSIDPAALAQDWMWVLLAAADALTFNEIGYIAIEPDHDRFQIALADGYHVHQANPADPRSWDAIGMGKREVVVVATGNAEVSRELTPLVQERLPGIARVIALRGAEAVEEFAALGMVPVDIAASGGPERLVDLVFASLGRERRLPVAGWADEGGLSAAA